MIRHFYPPSATLWMPAERALLRSARCRRPTTPRCDEPSAGPRPHVAGLIARNASGPIGFCEAQLLAGDDLLQTLGPTGPTGVGLCPGFCRVPQEGPTAPGTRRHESGSDEGTNSRALNGVPIVPPEVIAPLQLFLGGVRSVGPPRACCVPTCVLLTAKFEK